MTYFSVACVAGVSKGGGRELGRETTREGGGRRGRGSFPFSLARPNSPFQLTALKTVTHPF